MKSTGIVRKVDELGRIVLPVELRRILDISIRDSLEIYVEGSKIILEKIQSSCVFCGEKQDVIDISGKKICRTCLDMVKNIDASAQ